MTLSDLLKLLKGKQFSGAVLLHFQHGSPKLVEIPKDRLTISPESVDTEPALSAK